MADHMSYENIGGPTVQERTADAVDQALQKLKASNKRKRETSDQGGDPKHPGSRRTSSNNLNGNGHDVGDMSRGLYSDASSSSQDFSALSQHLVQHVNNANHGLPDNSNASSTAAAALAGIIPQLTVPQPTELSFVSSGSGTDGDRQIDPAFDLGVPDNGQNPNIQGSPYNLGGFQGATSAQLQAARESSNGGGPKPPVGSDEWHKVRRDNHKEVERRRRETINEGINELAKIVPGCEKNKGSILQRAVQYITSLRQNEDKNIEKWTLEKLLTDQAIDELSTNNTKLKAELEQVKVELEQAESELERVSSENNHLKPQFQSRDSENERLKALLQLKDSEIQLKDNEMERLEAQLQSRELDAKGADDAGGTDDDDGDT